jgi:plastocyanin
MAAGAQKEIIMSLSRLAAVAALSILVGTPAAAQPAPQSVTIAVFSFGFTPKPIHLRAGQPVTLTFVNQSGHGHDFTAPEFFASSAIGSGAAPGGRIPLAGGQTKSITLTPRAGTYPAHCSHFLHSSFGMTTTVIVN